jgi:ABC-type nitrate/sulfonate/bicarbonate transport system substrate-binding protein
MRHAVRASRVVVLLLVVFIGAVWPGERPTPPEAVAAAPAQPAVQGRTRVEQGQVVLANSYIDLYVATARGLFTEQGLDVESTVFNDPGSASRAFVGGDLQFANIGLDYMLRAADRTNNNIAIVAGQERRPAFALITTADVADYAGLRGQVLAVVGPNDGTTLLLRRMLAANGLRDGDYDMQVVGGTPNRIAALQAGVAKGAMIAAPAFFTVVDQGMRQLGISADYVGEYAFSNHYVRRDWAERNRETVVRYLTAIVKADRWVRDPANKDEGIRILAEATRTALPLARRSWDYAIEQLDSHAHDGDVSLAGVANIMEMLADIGDLARPLPPPERFVDTRYLEEARQRAQ